ncbi:MAG: beta-ketoacyl-[acyl-carrier-protein] synthase family protein [Verrucomicrobia bacterium]|nr:beta-ketoacyl-[acyl-carrier-protein] synthase family protein [Verrucomicrobiota bacterium]
MKRAVITGLGPVTPIGVGRAAFWQGLRAQQSAIARVTAFDTFETGLNAHHAGELRDWDPRAFFPPHRLKRLDRYAQFAVASARLALADAGLAYDAENPEPRPRVGVSFGTALGGIAGAEHQHGHFVKKGARGVNPTLAVQVFGGSAHANIAIECGFRGPGTTNSNSCASGTVAVGEALRYIRDGLADVIVAGGAEAPLSPLTFGAFAFIKSMSQWQGEPPARACRPFDATRDGFVMGEGACALIVEEYEHARARGARIYCEVLGYSLNNDAYHMTSPLPDGASAIAAIRAALADARVPSEEIGYVNAHASSSPLNDAAETLAIKAALGEAHARRIPVSGTKPYHAHALGATGAIEAAICALALAHGWVPPTLHYEAPDPPCDLDIVPNEGREYPHLRRVLSNSFGFGGINSCLVFGKI